MSSRLQGSGSSYTTMLSNIATNLSTSPFFKQSDMIENLNKFIETGVAYNLELRSYVATTSEKIASTFNAFDSSLLRIIRIQQEDSTTARLGMEAVLTQFLNSQYQDTSYLSGVGRNVTGLLTEAESLMSTRGSTEFEYVVQKWLGSLGSLGVSDTALTSIATGLGYLGSGNVSALSSNQTLQTLLTMASSRAGLNYGNLLTSGVSASDANKLLASIVSIATNVANSNNNVVMSQYASLFGMNVSDIVSIANITANDLKTISQNMLTYENMKGEVASQLANISSRTTAAEMVQNVISNMMTTTAAGVTASPLLYGTWLAANLMESSGIDPTINLGFLGTGTSFNTSTLLKTGVVGIGGIQALATGIGNMFAGNAAGTSLSAWNQSDVTSRGRGYQTTSGTTTSTTSYVGSLDSGALAGTASEIGQQAATYTGDSTEDSEYISRIDENVGNIRVDISNLLDKIDNLTQSLNISGVLRGI